MSANQPMTRRCLGWEGTHEFPVIMYDAGPNTPITDGMCEVCYKVIADKIEEFRKGNDVKR